MTLKYYVKLGNRAILITLKNVKHCSMVMLSAYARLVSKEIIVLKIAMSVKNMPTVVLQIQNVSTHLAHTNVIVRPRSQVRIQVAYFTS